MTHKPTGLSSPRVPGSYRGRVACFLPIRSLPYVPWCAHGGWRKGSYAEWRAGARVFRPVISIVSAVSGCVANDHQALHHVSCSPSKIPYVGFSPVRLQTGIQLRPSRAISDLSTEPAYLVDPPAYTQLQSTPPPLWPNGHVQRGRLARTIQSRGPWLARGYVVPPGLCLI